MDLLSVSGLNKTYPGGLFEKDHVILKDVNFKLSKGLTTGFVGSNGAGKTTTIKCLFDFVRPDSGEILFFGQKISNQIRNKIGYMPERPYLYEFLTGEQFLKLHWMLCYGKNEQGFAERMSAVLKQVDLAHAQKKRLRTYSKGMLQRIGIAQAILTEPELLVLDEPMSGLDPDGRALVKDILRAEQSRGCSIFFSSHLLADMEELCSDLVVIDKGKILFNDKLNLFMKEYQSLEQAFKILKKEQQ